MNLENMLVGDKLTQKKSQIKKVFFYRICGTGMGACACLAKEAGYEVAGADLSFSPPMSTYLETQNIPLLRLDDLSKEDLQEYDLIIVGNSVPRSSEYAKFIEECGVSFTSFPSFLGEFILKDREVIGLCGTHGKTTSTYFIAQILEKLGEKPGYFVGGIINDRAPSTHGESKYFVIESDEYDSAYFQKISKFRLYELNHMILTSLEFDHADIFNSIEDIKDEFRAIIPDLSGEIVASDSYQAITELQKEYPTKPWTIYGASSDAGPHDLRVENGTSYFFLKLGGSKVPFETNVIGEHNILNISSCLILLHKQGFEIKKLQASIKSLGMVKRRQEERGHYKNALVIDDFAHHPKAIDLTIDAIKQKYPGKKVLTIFEPISATARSSVFQNEFALTLGKSDGVIIAANPLKTTVKDSQNLDIHSLVSDLGKNIIFASRANNLSELVNEIDKNVSNFDLLLILSNRTCLGLWESDFVTELK